MRRVALLFILAACSPDERAVDFADINIPPPSTADLESRLRAFREGREKYHGDPRMVAHVALNDYVDVPWRADPYRAGEYEFHKSNPQYPQWGSYVVRGYVETRGSRRTRRYRVKIRPYEEIWYPVQVSRFMLMELDEDPESEGPPNVRKQ